MTAKRTISNSFSIEKWENPKIHEAKEFYQENLDLVSKKKIEYESKKRMPTQKPRPILAEDEQEMLLVIDSEAEDNELHLKQ